jgi:acetyltransferase-like isoleucine patch superfamily enzyme
MAQSKPRLSKRVLNRLSRRAGRKRVVDPSARLVTNNDDWHVSGHIVIGPNSSLTIEAGATVDSDISIGDNCTMILRQGSRISDSIVDIRNDSVVELGDGAIIDSPVTPRSSVTIDRGSLILHRRAHVMSSDLLVRFGGKMTIGSYTGIAYRSEIRCEEQVDIGSYGMISYGVCIYDTNTHSTDWRERRKKIEQCYPGGVSEDTKPMTKAVFIGDDVWIGKEVTITKGARIGNRCIVGIRAVIGSETVEDDSIIVAPKPRVIGG